MKPVTKLTLIAGTIMAGIAGTELLHLQAATAAPPLLAQQCAHNYPARIQFQPGTRSTQIHGEASDCNSIGRYVLRARAGQTMIITANSPDTPIPLYLTIYGADGTILIRDNLQSSQWRGRLPLTEDYYINVVSSIRFLPDYNLDVVIR